MDTIKLYCLYIKYSVKANAQFKANFAAAWLSNLVTYFIFYLQIWIITRTYPVIDDWNCREIILLMALHFFTYSVANTALYGVLHKMDEYINNGDLDRLLLRPTDPIFSIVCKDFNWTGISQILLSGIFLVYGLLSTPISWSIGKITVLFACLAGAVSLQCGFFLILGAMAFWIKKSASLASLLYYNFAGFMNYPITIFHRGIRILLSTVLPWAYINYYPAAHLLGKSISLPRLYLLNPFLGILALLCGIRLMKIGISQYESVGN